MDRGGFTVGSNVFAGTGANSNENDGIFLGNNQTVIAITPSDTNTTAHIGTFDTLAYLTLPSTPGPVVQEVLFQDLAGTPVFDFNNGDLTPGRTFVLGTNLQDMTVRALDTYYTLAPTAASLHPAVGYGVLSPESSDYRQVGLFLFSTQDAVGAQPILRTSCT